jgi:2-polyprenyl-3-methyl-5-hydroxy-6-metoxy-1,4-benzoquinol methylase
MNGNSVTVGKHVNPDPVAWSASGTDTDAMDSGYSQKPKSYFDGARKSFVEALPHNPTARLLEIGAGTGATAAYALAQGKCGWCCGVELCEEPAREAKARLSQVVVGDVESITLNFPEDHFDLLFLSEVLEHLRDPWAVLIRLARLMKPGAIVMAGSPNVCHHGVIRNLLRGRWRYEPQGIYDATHLRWFTPASYREMFEQSGFVVDSVGPARPLGRKARWLNRLTGRRWEYLLHSQIWLRGHRR